MDLKQLRALGTEASQTLQQMRLAAGTGAAAGLRVEERANAALGAIEDAATTVRSATIGIGIVFVVWLTVIGVTMVRSIR